MNGMRSRPTSDELNAKAERLLRLHKPGQPLVLPNAWDAASAQLVEATGFPVVATSSGAIAATLGYPDEDCMPPREAFSAIERIAKVVSAPVTADIEAGYRLEPQAVVEALVASGAVGCNIEDTDHHTQRELTPIETQATLLTAMRSTAQALGVKLVINARVDVFRRERPVTPEMFKEGVRRATAYVEAGADCVYPIRLNGEDLIGRFVQLVQAPVNIMFTPDAPSLSRLAGLDVARISFAGGLMRHAYEALGERLRELRGELSN